MDDRKTGGLWQKSGYAEKADASKSQLGPGHCVPSNRERWIISLPERPSRQAPAGSSTVTLIFVGSSGMPGPIVVARVALRT